MNFFLVGDNGLDVSSGFAYCTVAPYVGSVGGAGVAVCPGLDGQNVPGLVQRTLAWTGVLCDACSPNLV
jgi:hypothetical protein